MSRKPQIGAVKIPLVNQLTFLGQSFSRLVDMALGYLVQVCSTYIICIYWYTDSYTTFIHVISKQTYTCTCILL